MLTCFTQQLLYHKEKCPFLVWQSYIDRSSLHICPRHFLSLSRLLWHSCEEFTSTARGKSVLPPLPNISRQCKHSPSSHCLWVCVHCVPEHSVFKGTRINVKHQLPSSSFRAAREAPDSQQEAHASYSRRTQVIAFRGRVSLYYRLAMCGMLRCVLTSFALLQQTVSQE